MPGGQKGRQLRAVPNPAPTDPHPVEQLDQVVLACRADGHRFPYGDPKLDQWHKHRDPQTGRVTSASRSLMCPPDDGGCGTIVRDVVERGAAGTRQRQYTYPKGYSMPKGQGITRREARAELMGRIFALFDADDDRPAAGRSAG